MLQIRETCVRRVLDVNIKSCGGVSACQPIRRQHEMGVALGECRHGVVRRKLGRAGTIAIYIYL